MKSNYKEYAENIINGKIPSCKYVKMACERYLSWFERDDIYFDEEGVGKGKLNSGIIKGCRGYRKTAGGVRWKFKGD